MEIGDVKNVVLGRYFCNYEDKDTCKIEIEDGTAFTKLILKEDIG
jgi:hypothetical protein